MGVPCRYSEHSTANSRSDPEIYLYYLDLKEEMFGSGALS